LIHLAFALEMKYISSELYSEFETESEEIDKMLNGYIGFLKKSKQGANEPGANYQAREETIPYIADSFEDFQDTDDTTL